MEEENAQLRAELASVREELAKAHDVMTTLLAAQEQPASSTPETTEAIYHTLILDLKILIQIPLLFSNTFKFTVFSTVLQLRTSLSLSFKLLHKIIQKGILVISRNGTRFSPYNLSLSLVNLFA